MSVLIDRQAALKYIVEIRQAALMMDDIQEASVIMAGTYLFEEAVRKQSSARPETCEGCKHFGKWENEGEYGYPSPCTCCKKGVDDYYEK